MRWIWTCLWMIGVGSSEALAGPPVILIIESYHPVLAWTEQCEDGIRQALGPGYEVHSFFMDAKRIPETEIPARAEEAWSVFERTEPDLVMVGDDNALSLLGPRLVQTGIPLVYFGINNNPRNYFETLPPNMAGVLERTPVVPWLRHLSSVLPQASRALVLLDKSLTSDSIISQTFRTKSQIQVNGLFVDYHVALDWDDWQRQIHGAGTYDFVLTPTFHAVRGKDGYIDIETVIRWSAEHSPVPMFSNQEYTVGDQGLVGALVLVGTEHGRLAGEIAREILEQQFTPRDVPHRMDKDGQYYFSQKQLDRFHIILPPEIRSKAIFKQ